MLKIRLQRIGRRNNAAFRLIVAESTQGPKSGKHVEILGSYNPHTNTRTFNAERVQYWISKGAQVSDTAHNLLVTEKIIEGKKKNALPKKSPIVKEAKTDDVGSPEKKEEGAEDGSAEETAKAPSESETTTEKAPAEETAKEKDVSKEDPAAASAEEAESEEKAAA